MAHSRLNLNAMFDWIERCLADGQPTPLDAAICDRFGFDSTESARTLLAELADAGRITIRGHRDDRVIALGRSKSVAVPASRAEPPVRKADPDAEHTSARIAEIVGRGRKPAKAVVAENAAALLKTVATKPAQPKPAPSNEKEADVPAKTIQLPASADDVIALIEAHAKKNDVSLGLATVSLVKRGLSSGAFEPGAGTASVEVAAEQAVEQLDIDVLVGELTRRLSAAALSTDLGDQLSAMTARAEAAEAKLAQMKALFA